ncbi:MAG: prephenate dehydrogenase [Vulcanimicrobiaceae bacterium]
MILGLFGTGMMGSSIGLRARHNGEHVIGYDVDTDALRAALACGAIDEAVSRDDLYTRAEIIVIAAHVGATIAEITRLAELSLPSDLLICDIASTKWKICRAARTLPQFLATHPMAGNERSGPQGASATLFEGRTWAYIPSERDDLMTKLRAFIVSLGGIPLAVDAREHDRLVATTSHLPQICASVFASEFARLVPHDSATALCGPTAREFLRLSSSRSAMWAPILATNRANIAPLLRRFADHLSGIADALEREDDATITALFT